MCPACRAPFLATNSPAPLPEYLLGRLVRDWNQQWDEAKSRSDAESLSESLFGPDPGVGAAAHRFTSLKPFYLVPTAQALLSAAAKHPNIPGLYDGSWYTLPIESLRSDFGVSARNESTSTAMLGFIGWAQGGTRCLIRGTTRDGRLSTSTGGRSREEGFPATRRGTGETAGTTRTLGSTKRRSKRGEAGEPTGATAAEEAGQEVVVAVAGSPGALTAEDHRLGVEVDRGDWHLRPLYAHRGLFQRIQYTLNAGFTVLCNRPH